MNRETATYRCPQCRRQHRVLADEYGDHGCICGWEPYASAIEALDPEDVRDYVDYCRDINVKPDAFAFSTLHRRKYGGVPGREIQRLLDEEYTKEDGE
ncbi:hypothetical protein [Paenibacillus abyssi]|uniref:Uncharacterized protein n=1 Tax=Paenibacillus abyssi TaxID=1340531 RepID=A0A917CIX2_9BACL|nr:hypothetical protein [Paenibacillus abyssi]GGF88192.1 hypothetical protein GCM10010916_01860 [Paenibacillus abyssi]